MKVHKCTHRVCICCAAAWPGPRAYNAAARAPGQLAGGRPVAGARRGPVRGHGAGPLAGRVHRRPRAVLGPSRVLGGVPDEAMVLHSHYHRLFFILLYVTVIEVDCRYYFYDIV